MTLTITSADGAAEFLKDMQEYWDISAYVRDIVSVLRSDGKLPDVPYFLPAELYVRIGDEKEAQIVCGSMVAGCADAVLAELAALPEKSRKMPDGTVRLDCDPEEQILHISIPADGRTGMAEPDSIVPESFCAYLEENGWQRVPRRRTDIAVHQKESERSFRQVTVPLDPALSDFAEAMERAVKTAKEAGEGGE